MTVHSPPGALLKPKYDGKERCLSWWIPYLRNQLENQVLPVCILLDKSR